MLRVVEHVIHMTQVAKRQLRKEKIRNLSCCVWRDVVRMQDRATTLIHTARLQKEQGLVRLQGCSLARTAPDSC